LERLVRRSDAVAEVGAEAGLVVDAATCHRVASWGYASAHAGGASAWVAPNAFEVIDPSYAACFGQDRV
jgi:hypothetical protein